MDWCVVCQNLIGPQCLTRRSVALQKYEYYNCIAATHPRDRQTNYLHDIHRHRIRIAPRAHRRTQDIEAQYNSSDQVQPTSYKHPVDLQSEALASPILASWTLASLRNPPDSLHPVESSVRSSI